MLKGAQNIQKTQNSKTVSVHWSIKYNAYKVGLLIYNGVPRPLPFLIMLISETFHSQTLGILWENW